ncbi:hypothetical protein EHW99_0300 [Erwinia amylovora]|uniref:Uncharacterized protein n=3 Tax=Erwinia amylovora TaxID=552 RepID=A0A830ZYG0_ERWAM|nr:hypothetical protein EaACW_3342 [Erwinia amylovora ACW56400]QJQ53007.1 hypothetical protein EHX00_0300 [Erwinia amylovora]CBA23439.1 hypothetical protein predicted by Glimmer/Critica [Erwinia amylovora CFBP1430]CBX82202.1 hypothetical protein predicted by Glimmer/Critica [Erwinia amylovora ATCC BAA-2158]CCO80179.1 hypothetical protein BN432_3410 [Erwinia amylovora Ea356]CCO83983.1 hypothetical protein BN433_3436 [Erwinia amylovora Ea266]CCO87745.1 hypothetical protein BN434_3386 [Erwinia a
MQLAEKWHQRWRKGGFSMKATPYVWTPAGKTEY